MHDGFARPGRRRRGRPTRGHSHDPQASLPGLHGRERRGGTGRPADAPPRRGLHGREDAADGRRPAPRARESDRSGARGRDDHGLCVARHRAAGDALRGHGLPRQAVRAAGAPGSRGAGARPASAASRWAGRRPGPADRQDARPRAAARSRPGRRRPRGALARHPARGPAHDRGRGGVLPGYRARRGSALRAARRGRGRGGRRLADGAPHRARGRRDTTRARSAAAVAGRPRRPRLRGGRPDAGGGRGATPGLRSPCAVPPARARTRGAGPRRSPARGGPDGHGGTHIGAPHGLRPSGRGADAAGSPGRDPASDLDRRAGGSRPRRDARRDHRATPAGRRIRAGPGLP